MKTLSSLVVFLLLFVQNLSAQNECACTNCPLAITDNATFQGFLDVTVDGPNDLAECPVTELCMTITHTWVGDLSVTLTSPGGLNYLVMADDNNDFGGCGNSSNNIDICIVPGTFNPLTNNTVYNCNGTDPCLEGDWTMPCGGVTDPVSGAVQAPNCDLNDFNQPGQPVNGTWTLTVNDICGFDIGFLETWSLSFGCSIESCFSCPTDGGFLDAADIAGCVGDEDLNLDLVPSYPGSVTPPDPNTTDYIWILAQAGTILDIMPDPDLSTLSEGAYELCGLSVEAGQLSFFEAYEGASLSSLLADLNDPDLPLCADLSDNCLSVMIGAPIPTTIETVTICENECFELPDGSLCCAPGPCEYAFASASGCDSLVIYELDLLPTQEVFQADTLCTDDCITIDGTEYCPPGNYEIVFTNQAGCDSTLFLELTEVSALADVAPPGVLSCFMLSLTLDGSGSIGDTFSWTDEDGNILGADPQLTVDSAGTYFFTVSNTLGSTTCSSTVAVLVEADYVLPALPVISGASEACIGDVITYSIPTDPEAESYLWTFPANAQLVDGDPNSTEITLEWINAGSGQVCAVAINPCGEGEEACLEVLSLDIPKDPVITGPETACKDDPPFLMSTVDTVGIQTYSWTVPSDATIVSGEDSPTIEVQWGDLESGEVCLTVSNICGESNSTCLTIEKACNFWDVPNAFSPNGDGTNDRFTVIKGSGVTITRFVIYNRWGEIVYDSPDDQGWDGTVDGEPAPAEAYAYILKLELSDGELVDTEGEVLLLR